MALHVIFIDDEAEQLSDVTSNFTSVQIPSNAFIMRIADSEKSYSNSTLTKLFEVDNTFYSKVLEYTTKGDYPYIDINVSDFGGFTAIFNQLSAQFIGGSHLLDIYDFSDYGGSSSGGDIDFSTIVTALNGIATALSALTNLSNLSNLADLANIISAINNKDNQSNIVDELRYIFTQDMGESTVRNVSNKSNLSLLKGYYSGATLNSLSVLGRSSLANRLTAISSVLSASNYSIDNLDYSNNNNKLLNRLLYTLSNPVTSSSVLKEYSDTSKLNSIHNIETKLEQNLPFTTIVNNDYIDNCVSASVAYNKKIENIPFN